MLAYVFSIFCCVAVYLGAPAGMSEGGDHLVPGASGSS